MITAGRMQVLRRTLLAVSRYHRVQNLVTGLPISAAIVERYIAGDSAPDAVRFTQGLHEGGLRATIDCLGEQVRTPEQAQRMQENYVELLGLLAQTGLHPYAEVSVKLSALGQLLPQGRELAGQHLRAIAQAARNAGTTVTVDMEDSLSTDATLLQVRQVRQDFPETAAVLQANLHRTEEDCRALAQEGSRVRLCKGAYREPPEVAYQRRKDIDRSYARCLGVLMAAPGYPMVATHDAVMIELALHLAQRYHRETTSYELQMLHGIRPQEQLRLAHLGHTVRIYLPYGTDWYGYMMRRLAEKPANLGLFMRSLTSKK